MPIFDKSGKFGKMEMKFSSKIKLPEVEELSGRRRRNLRRSINFGFTEDESLDEEETSILD